MSEERMSRLDFITEVSNAVRDAMDRLLEQMKAECPDLLDCGHDQTRDAASQVMEIRNNARKLYNMLDIMYWNRTGQHWNEEDEEDE